MKLTPYGSTDTQKRRHEAIALDLTALPTAAGREDRVQAYIDRWLARRKATVRWCRDVDGNLLIQSKRSSTKPPIFFTAHLDHPGFVVVDRPDPRTVVAEFRGGVMDAYFVGAKVEFFDSTNTRFRGTVCALAASEPFKCASINLTRANTSIAPNDIGRWAFPPARWTKTLLKTNACDDLAAVAAALCAFDRIRARRGMGHVGLLFTVAEEVGFIGAIGAAQRTFVPKNSRLVCLENSRASDECPLGAGPVVRVGDRMSVFSPTLTNTISDLARKYEAEHPSFTWQRKLMVGGACEATAFAALGYQSTCLCLPLGNYHNMERIDEVKAGERPATVGQEFVHRSDYHGLIELLEIIAANLDSTKSEMARRIAELRTKRTHVLSPVDSPR
jgi:putative aminopeptidase FrvX